MLNKIKSVLKYYSDMLTSINYHTKEISKKNTKILENSKKLEDLSIEVSNTLIDGTNSNKRDNNINVRLQIVCTNQVEFLNTNSIKMEYTDTLAFNSKYSHYLIVNEKKLNLENLDLMNNEITYYTSSNMKDILYDNNRVYRFNKMNSDYLGSFLIPSNKYFDFNNQKFNFIAKKCGEYDNFNLVEPKVSFIIPVYNTEIYVEETIWSILKQEGMRASNFEIILIDDCSTDNSYNIISKFKNYSNIRIYKNESNIGLGRTRNKGVKLAKFEWINFIDSDDTIHTKLYRSYQKALSVYNDIEVIGYKLVVKTPTKMFWNIKSPELKSIYSNKKLESDEYKVLIYDTSACTKLFKKSLIENIEFGKGSYEDGILTAKLYNQKFLMLNFPGYYYRKEGQPSITLESGQKLFEQYNSCLKIILSNIKYLEKIKAKDDFIFEYLNFSVTNRLKIIENKLYKYTKDDFIYYKKNFELLNQLSKILNKYKIFSKYFIFSLSNTFEEYFEIENMILNDEVQYNNNIFFCTLKNKCEIEIPVKYLVKQFKGKLALAIKNNYNIISQNNQSLIVYIENEGGENERQLIDFWIN